MDAKLMLVHVLSSLHAGTGQDGGIIDQPIAREKTTGTPFLPGSSIKGVLRDACPDADTCLKVFGPKTDKADEYAGSVHFTDGRLLLLPVRSLNGVFAWVTSPFILRRFLRDLEIAKQNWEVAIPVCEDHQCRTASSDNISSQQENDNQVILEDLPLTKLPSPEVDAWALKLGAALFPDDANNWQQMLATHLCIVSDNIFGFILETATEVTARIRLDDTKTVARGALWYEETLPAETVLAGLITASPVAATKDEVFDAIRPLTTVPVQFGGNATVGRGLCKLHLLDD
ncbi:MAG: type III-B CRISPR module RAMP protein Cmr4 [Chloroflexi bacterium]|nr:type III-B CRISPR module RAMP protein Cmr4 [Chloroflexota bacterium]